MECVSSLIYIHIIVLKVIPRGSLFLPIYFQRCQGEESCFCMSSRTMMGLMKAIKTQVLPQAHWFYPDNWPIIDVVFNKKTHEDSVYFSAKVGDSSQHFWTVTVLMQLYIPRWSHGEVAQGTLGLSNWQESIWDSVCHLVRSQLCSLKPSGGWQVFTWKTLPRLRWIVQYSV